MKLFKEHLKILKCFFYEDYSFEDVSNILNISQHKIRRHLNELYNYYNVDDIKSLKNKLKSDWLNILKVNLEITNLDRRNYIILSFLKNDFINLTTISLKLNVSRRTLSKDLNEVKIFLNNYNLTCSSLNSKGIELIGDENNKKILFNHILSMIFIERDYIPNIFNSIFNDFNLIIDSNIQKLIKNLLKKKNVIPQSYIIIQFEIVIFIALIRKPIFLNIYSFKFEIKTILLTCNNSNRNDIFKNFSSEFEKIKKFMEYLQSIFFISHSFSNNTYIALITRIALIEFKNNTNMSEFYLINKEFEKKYKSFYINFIKITENYFKKTFNYKVDSFDKILLFLILKNYLYINNNKNIIVYDFLQILFLNNLIDELKEKNIIISEAVSIYSLKSYLKDNQIDNILNFEDINFKNFIILPKNIKITKVSFPLNEGDYLKIKQNFSQTKIKKR